MRIPIEVNVVMEKCRDCPRLELETIRMPISPDIHRCKHVQLCRTIVDLWEQEKRGELQSTEMKEP